jgi:hypothetical protein
METSFTPQLLYPQGKRLQYPLGRKLGGPRVGLNDIKHRSLAPDKNRIPAVQPAAIITELFQLS